MMQEGFLPLMGLHIIFMATEEEDEAQFKLLSCSLSHSENRILSSPVGKGNSWLPCDGLDNPAVTLTKKLT